MRGQEKGMIEIFTKETYIYNIINAILKKFDLKVWIKHTHRIERIGSYVITLNLQDLKIDQNLVIFIAIPAVAVSLVQLGKYFNF